MGLQIKNPIVDNDRITTEILKDLIADRERSVDVCHDGLIAIKNLEKNNNYLIIFDLVMPKMGGLDVFKHTKRNVAGMIHFPTTPSIDLWPCLPSKKRGCRLKMNSWNLKGISLK